MFRRFRHIRFEKNVKLCYNNSRYVKRQNKRKFMTQSRRSKDYKIIQDSRLHKRGSDYYEKNENIKNSTTYYLYFINCFFNNNNQENVNN